MNKQQQDSSGSVRAPDVIHCRLGCKAAVLDYRHDGFTEKWETQYVCTELSLLIPEEGCPPE